MDSLKNAPKETQLAVDLIYLLETSDVETDVVLKALEIVKNDYLTKQAAEATCSSSN
ncbi:YbaM family protein [Providencia vermicola]|uniref:YbaM family protein n=2 Tax=Providencia TaxID=586 RepID=A0AAI9MWG5_PROST|nr:MULTISPECIES: YbaM family protein [Providencia]ELR5043016.1 YbaM family protein [Providencia rettgeri]ELR5035874.1 YbaM family protein [Providencia stuartii]ELR5121917.1 YbaM family protein [Providencia stuartii]ELR5140817.1 YbaM family protein [Providencia stuartii]ELR5290214.1 YbaM family protein [Providencia stuartii]